MVDICAHSRKQSHSTVCTHARTFISPNKLACRSSSEVVLCCLIAGWRCCMLLRSLLALLACLSLAYAATPAPAADVQLAWDAPVQADGTPVPNVAGYKLY